MKDFYVVTGYLPGAGKREKKSRQGLSEIVEILSRRALIDRKSALKLMKIAIYVADEMVKISNDSDQSGTYPDTASIVRQWVNGEDVAKEIKIRDDWYFRGLPFARGGLSGPVNETIVKMHRNLLLAATETPWEKIEKAGNKPSIKLKMANKSSDRKMLKQRVLRAHYVMTAQTVELLKEIICEIAPQIMSERAACGKEVLLKRIDEEAGKISAAEIQ